MSLSNIVRKNLGKLIIVSTVLGYVSCQKISYELQLQNLEQIKNEKGAISAIMEARNTVINIESDKILYLVKFGKNVASQEFMYQYNTLR